MEVGQVSEATELIITFIVLLLVAPRDRWIRKEKRPGRELRPFLLWKPIEQDDWIHHHGLNL